ncbi:hypothetical protein [Halalkalibacter alkalisediminis]|uniref:DUF4488 domain-containing protein n=1 Tax=Halalkalibacter alkalisediminis TaxID=935616 RepID=A0ABV6NNA8_9BACI|nr:hypothetical protein [Halalkalibacter alkalisediminis]
MKAKSIIPIFIVGLLVVWVVISMLLPPNLKAESKENGWKAIYTVDNSLKKTWAGNLSWEKRQGKLLDVRFIENGKVISYMNTEDQVNMKENDKREFAYLGQKPIEKNTYQLYIHWEEDGEKYEETLEFKPVKRLLVIPKFS